MLAPTVCNLSDFPATTRPKTRGRKPLLILQPLIPIKRRIATPIGRVLAERHVPMKRRPRPIHNPRHQPVLERIDMHIIDTPLEIRLIAHRVLKESPLQHTTLSPPLPTRRPGQLATAAAEKLLRESTLDLPPPQRISVVPRRQRPNRVQMIRQQHDRVDSKRMTPANFPKRLPQRHSRDPLRKHRPSPQRNDGKKERPTRHKPPPIPRHPPTPKQCRSSRPHQAHVGCVLARTITPSNPHPNARHPTTTTQVGCVLPHAPWHPNPAPTQPQSDNIM